MVFIISTQNTIAQFSGLGYPFVHNYQRSEYQAGLQSWMITQTPNKLLYFANNDGLLEFDGYNWKLYTVTGNIPLRSVLASNNGKVYVGGYNNIGFFEPDEKGVMQFHSFLHLIPEDKRNFEEIWQITETSNGVVFLSFQQLIIVNNNKAKVYPTPFTFQKAFVYNNLLYLTSSNSGIVAFDNGTFRTLVQTNSMMGKNISAVISYEQNILLATTNNGVFVFNGRKTEKWATDVAEFLEKNQIFSAVRINNRLIAFGTIQNGVLICDNTGKPVFTINKNNGLQNNTILCMSTDHSGNLWLGTDNGITLIYINQPLRRLNHFQNLSAGYTAILHDSILYMGTNRGLFYKHLSECNSFPEKFEDFHLIPQTKGQIWKLQVIDNKLFCGHNNGAYIIRKYNAKLIYEAQGVWTFLQNPVDKNRIIAGTYNGLILFEKQSGKWKFKTNIGGFNESSRLIELDEENNIWMSHGFKGAYKLVLNKHLDSVQRINYYDRNKGFLSNFGVNIARLNNQLVFCCPDGIYTYNADNNRMVIAKKYNKLFKTKYIRQIDENKNGDIWYFTSKEVGVKRLEEDGSYKDINLPFNPLKGRLIGGFQFVYPINRRHILIGYENGFIHYVPSFQKQYNKSFQVFIERVKFINSDSILFSGHLFNNHQLKQNIDYQYNKLRFTYSAAFFEFPGKTEFSTYLEGYDTEWTEWSIVRNRDFNGLAEGNYIFHIKARNIYDVQSNVLTYEFNIEPPWMRSTLAYTVYLLIFIILIFIVFFLVHKRMKILKRKEKQRQKQKYIEREKELQKEALMSEKEIIRLRNEKLRQELKAKDKELANATMQRIHKNKLLNSFKKDLSKIYATTRDEEIKNHVRKIIRKVDSDINNEENWKVFYDHFESVHEQFLQRLKKQYPNISPAELRLCACLRMNISSKEIASLLNISVRGVESSRYRLRKTLNLGRETNLTDFILSI